MRITPLNPNCPNFGKRQSIAGFFSIVWRPNSLHSLVAIYIRHQASSINKGGKASMRLLIPSTTSAVSTTMSHNYSESLLWYSTNAFAWPPNHLIGYSLLLPVLCKWGVHYRYNRKGSALANSIDGEKTRLKRFPGVIPRRYYFHVL